MHPRAEAYFVVEHEPRLVWMRKPPYPVLGLDEAALEAAATAIFAPALQQGRPVSVWVVMPIEFRLSAADR